MLSDVATFLDDAIGFGTPGTLDAEAGAGIFDASSLLEDAAGAVTQAPSWTVSAAFAASATAGSAVAIGTGAAAVPYTVRQVLSQPPDGALVRLILTRV